MSHVGQPCYCGCRGSRRGSGTDAVRLKPTPKPRPKRPTLPPRPWTPIEQLLNFADRRFSDAELARFTEAIALARRSTVPRPNPYDQRRFLELTLTPGDASMYLTELRRRLSAGEPLVRDLTRRSE
jgi:hypothetical protein